MPNPREGSERDVGGVNSARAQGIIISGRSSRTSIGFSNKDGYKGVHSSYSALRNISVVGDVHPGYRPVMETSKSIVAEQGKAESASMGIKLTGV